MLRPEQSEETYAAYLGHFARALLGQPPRDAVMTLPELTAAALGIYDAKQGRDPANQANVLGRVGVLLGG
jgi:hypothetical protein